MPTTTPDNCTLHKTAGIIFFPRATTLLYQFRATVRQHAPDETCLRLITDLLKAVQLEHRNQKTIGNLSLKSVFYDANGNILFENPVKCAQESTLASYAKDTLATAKIIAQLLNLWCQNKDNPPYDTTTKALSKVIQSLLPENQLPDAIPSAITALNKIDTTLDAYQCYEEEASP